MKLTDESIMPFGKYRGKKLIDVPDAYLLWLWDNGVNQLDLKAYIEDNLAALRLKIRSAK